MAQDIFISRAQSAVARIGFSEGALLVISAMVVELIAHVVPLLAVRGKPASANPDQNRAVEVWVVLPL
jgi:hypothetical protein